MARKVVDKLFSGPTTSDRGALDAALGDVTLVRIYRGGYIVHSSRPGDDVLDPDTVKRISIVNREPITTTSDPVQIAELRGALGIAELVDFTCMCNGDLAIEFVTDRSQPAEVIHFDYPGTIEWRGWSGQARLAEPARILSWLSTREITLDI